MTIDGEENLYDKNFYKKISKEKIRENILDKNFKIAEQKTKSKQISKTPKKKKPLLKTGFILIIFGIIILAILKTNFVPWMYIGYDSGTEEGFYENYYFSNFISEKTDINNTIEHFFSSKNASQLIGLTINDFKEEPKISYYLSLIIICLGIIFSIFVFIDKKYDFSILNLYLFQTIFVTILSIFLVYFIFIIVKFLGANLLLMVNNQIIYSKIPNLSYIFPVPIVLIILLSILLKLCFTVVKSNYKEIIELTEKDSTKLLLNFRKKIGESRD